MVKRRKPVKRVYEKGRETTVSSVNKKKSVKRRPKKATVKKPAAKKKILKKQHILEPKVKRPFTDNYELPQYTDITRLTLMVKDPFWIYAYWDIGQDAVSLRENLRSEKSQEAELVLRMYDVTLVDFDGNNANRYFDIQPGWNSNNWYVNLWKDGVSYIGELGLKFPDGRFNSLARSNVVHTPRISYSPRTEQMWMDVKDDKHTSIYVAPSISAKKQQIDSIRKTSAETYRQYKRERMSLTEDEIRQYYGRLSPLLKDVISSRLSVLYGDRAKKYRILLEGESEEEKRRLFSFLPENYFIKRIVRGSSHDLVVIGGSESFHKGASELVQNKDKKSSFFFELNTELIVYGRTEHDAKVWLKDKNIELREDGTFSLRLALSDGKLPLEFKAVSNDEKRSKDIATYVDRNTLYRD